MTEHGFSNRFAVGIATTALSIAVGCADLQADGEALGDRDSADGPAAGEVLEQQSPPADAGELSGDNFKFGTITATGDGCPTGSWTLDKVPEGSAFTVTFEKYSIDAPATATPTVTTLGCTLKLEILTPRNLSYAVTSFQFFGYANLSPGMKARLLAAYSFSGASVTPARKDFRYDFPTPYDTTYAINDDAQTSAPVYTPCGAKASLEIKTSLILDRGTNTDAPGILAMDNVDARGQAALKVGIQTMRCPVTRTPQRSAS